MNCSFAIVFFYSLRYRGFVQPPFLKLCTLSLCLQCKKSGSLLSTELLSFNLPLLSI